MKKILWYLNRLGYFFVALFGLVFCIFRHPKKVYEFLFAVYSYLNEFVSVNYGSIKSFYKTETFKEISHESVFANCNVFNMDSKVTRGMETLVLSTLIKFFQPKTIFEIGTYDGFSTLHLALNSAPDSIVYTLDLPPNFNLAATDPKDNYSYDDQQVVQLSLEHIDQRVFKDKPEGRKIKELFGDSKVFDYSTYYQKIDFVFIDGNHSYEFIKSDTENAFKMLSANGVIVWHDYDYIVHQEVYRYLNELAKSHLLYYIPETRFVIYGPHIK